jgi:MFS transporter, DHA2 family, multidrug resistance protein
VVGSTLIGVFVFHALHRASHPLIDLRLLRNRMVASANATRFLYAAAFFGTCLLLPGYFQSVLGKTPLESGLLLLPQTLGSAAVIPLAGWLMEKRGPRCVVLTGMALNVAGMGVFIYGISQPRVHISVLLAGLAMFGIGAGCSITPVVWTAVYILKSREVAHGSTLVNVNYYTAAAIGPALMSVLLTGMFNRSPHIVAAQRADLIQEAAAKQGVAPDLSRLPQQVFAPDFMEHVTRELSRAYGMVFAVAAILFATTFLPVWFLPNKPGIYPGRTQRNSPAPAGMHPEGSTGRPDS